MENVLGHGLCTADRPGRTARRARTGLPRARAGVDASTGVRWPHRTGGDPPRASYEEFHRWLRATARGSPGIGSKMKIKRPTAIIPGTMDVHTVARIQDQVEARIEGPLGAIALLSVYELEGLLAVDRIFYGILVPFHAVDVEHRVRIIDHNFSVLVRP